MSKPQAERCPEGLDAYWMHVWDHALKVMKEQGSWDWELRPLLDEYVFALIESRDAREQGEDTKWDRHAKRASALADQLALTPRGRKAAGIVDNTEDADADPFAALDAGDELAPRRQARTA